MQSDTYEEATKAAYDVVAADYAVLLADELASKPLNRAMLDAFAEMVLGDGGGLVADLGCGPGRVSGYLHGRGLDVFGVDLSPVMVAVARESLPHLAFDVGSIASLDIGDGELSGAIAWYSIIHTPPADQPTLYAEFARVLRPGGKLLVAFQVGNEAVHLEEAYGHAVSLDAYRLDPDAVSAQLGETGFEPVARLITEPVERERTPQAFLLAAKRIA